MVSKKSTKRSKSVRKPVRDKNGRYIKKATGSKSNNGQRLPSKTGNLGRYFDKAYKQKEAEKSRRLSRRSSVSKSSKSTNKSTKSSRSSKSSSGRKQYAFEIHTSTEPYTRWKKTTETAPFLFVALQKAYTHSGNSPKVMKMKVGAQGYIVKSANGVGTKIGIVKYSV